MTKQDRLQARALRYLRKRIYSRVQSNCSRFQIEFAYLDEYLALGALKRFSKLDSDHLFLIYNILQEESAEYCSLLLDYGKE